MADPGSHSSASNGTTPPAPIRLSSFKTPRDLTLGGVKPNKKIFMPNLNVTRNKNKGQAINDRHKKENENGRRERRNEKNRNSKNGPNIIKGSGVFSEGMGAVEKRSSYVSHGRDIAATPTLTKPTIKVKDIWKIDKELDDQKIKKVLGYDAEEDDPEAGYDALLNQPNAPVRLPLTRRIPPKWVPRAVVKPEPLDYVDSGVPEIKMGEPMEVKARLKPEPYADTDVAALLRSDRPSLFLLQFPNKLPGGEAGCALGEVGAGRAGRLLVHQSGRVRLAMGGALFELSSGTQPAYLREAVSIGVDAAQRSAALVALGPLQHKLDVTPDWDTMLANIKL